VTARIRVRHGVAAATLAIALLAGALPSPAIAQGHDNRGRRADREQEYRRPAWNNGHWRDRYRHGGHYRRPDVYYGAPPVVLVPPRYYPQPGVTLNFGFPLYY